jgi:hypothetical protein
MSSFLSPLAAHGGLPTHFPHEGIPPPAHGGHPTHAPHGGIPPSAHGGLPTHAPHPPVGSFSLLASTAEHWCMFTLPGGVPPNVPSFIHGGGICILVPPIHFCSPHVPTSVAPSLGVSSSRLHSLLHEDAQSLLASDITMSFSVPVPPIASPLSLPLAPTEIPPAPQEVSAPAPAAVSLWSSESIKLPDIKDAKGYLDNHELIQYYLWLPDYSTQCSDSLLITDASNSEASQVWESLIHMAIKDGSLWFLFKKTRGCCILERVLRCLWHSPSTVLMILWPTPSLPSCPSSMTSRAILSPSWSFDLVLTVWSWT